MISPYIYMSYFYSHCDNLLIFGAHLVVESVWLKTPFHPCLYACMCVSLSLPPSLSSLSLSLSLEDTEDSSGSSSIALPGNSSTGSHSTRKNPDKPPRVRTVLTEHQLQTLRSIYSTNPRPDALLKEQLCELTGLSPRVIRVWFQNRRCKDKKKAQQAEAVRMQSMSGGKVREKEREEGDG